MTHAWQATIGQLTAALTRRHPHLTDDLEDITHHPDRPCLPVCRRCHRRHQQRGAQWCPRPDEPTDDGCLTCQIAHAWPRAAAMVDQGDGLRSPNLNGARSIGSHSDRTADTALAHLAATGEAAGHADDTGPRKSTAIAAARQHMRECEHWLRVALSGVDDPNPYRDRLRAPSGTTGTGEWNVAAATNREGRPCEK